MTAIATCDLLTVCSSEPTTYTEAITTYKLADIALTPGDGNGDFTIANGDASGRKLTIAQQTDILIDASGTAGWVALTLSGDTTLHARTTVTSQVLTAANTVTVPAWDIEIADPT